jgi:ribose/xylose/arabinose/galactoside ABC-type transport system permease subunit
MNNTDLRGKGQFTRIIFLSISLFVLVVFGSLITGGQFIAIYNVRNIIYQFITFVMIGVSTFVVMSSGGIDFSIGSLVGLSAFIVASFNGSFVGSIIAIFISLIVGFLNGFIAVKTTIKPFIITIATMTLIRYIGFAISNGDSKNFFVASDYFLVLLFFALFVIALSYFLLKRYGNNEEYNNGITKTKNDIHILFYILSSFSASVVGIFYAFRLRSGLPHAGAGFEIDALIIAVLGGALINYAPINIFATIIAALLFSVLRNLFLLAGINSYIYNILSIVILFIGFIPIITKGGLIPIKKSTLRIIGRVAILLVVMGFFMPVGCEQTGFELADSIMEMGKIGRNNSSGVALYILFISALIGGLLIIPLVMKKKMHIGIDWTTLLVSIVCGLYAYSQLKETFDAYGDLGGEKLQIGGYFILIGLLGSLFALIFELITKEQQEKSIPPPQ